MVVTLYGCVLLAFAWTVNIEKGQNYVLWYFKMYRFQRYRLCSVPIHASALCETSISQILM